MNLKLKVWRQQNSKSTGKFVDYDAPDIPGHCSFLEMLDIVNEGLSQRGEEPIAFDHDCREGICGMCSLVINGVPHGPNGGTTTCQLHMRHFHDGETIYVEPFRAHPFPVLRDLVVERTALDRIQQAGGFISARAGSAPDGNSVPIPKTNADLAMDAAACIGCGACVAACPNGAAALFTAAKIGHLGLLPQGQPERETRALKMVAQVSAEGFGHCTSAGECEAVCPKGIPITFIARMNREFIHAAVVERPQVDRAGD
jgi:succinate dehydrogenase / fumarate reductase iron-sulfur subunit